MSRLEPGRIRAENLGRRFEIAAQGGRSLRATLLRREHHKPREFWALRHVDLDIAPGETFGIVGRNGSGKSTLLKMLARIFGPTEGSCEVGGRLSSLLELGAGFHPEFSAIENIYLSAAIYGIPRDEVRRDIESIIDFAELEEFKDQPVKTFSSGMFARLGFSVAMHVKPDVLLLDEVLAVGDEAFVQKCLRTIADYRINGGTLAMVSHDGGSISMVCDSAILLEHGEVTARGTGLEVIRSYRERLQASARTVAPGESGGAGGVEVAAVIRDHNGADSTRVSFGLPFSIEATITFPQATGPTRVGFGVRDAMGRPYGDRSVQEVRFEARQPETVRLDVAADHPFRDGTFTVDIGVSQIPSLVNMARELRVATFSVANTEPDHHGAIAIPGSMSVKRGTA